MEKGDLLKEQGILREDEGVCNMHAQLFLLLLTLNASEPKRVLRLLSPDLWIAAVSVYHKYDHVLTTNKKDFPGELFEEVAHLRTGDFHVYLLVFRRQLVRELWQKLAQERTITIHCDSFFRKSG